VIGKKGDIWARPGNDLKSGVGIVVIAADYIRPHGDSLVCVFTHRYPWTGKPSMVIVWSRVLAMDPRFAKIE
jgi:hypothetical protein